MTIENSKKTNDNTAVDITVADKMIPPHKLITTLLGSVAVGILCNILFYDKTPGISIPIFIIGFYLFFFLIMRDTIHIRLDIETYLLLTILLLSATFALFDNPILKFFNILVIPLLILSHTILASGRNNYSWYHIGFISDLICEGLVGLLAYTTKPFSVLGQLAKKFHHPDRVMTVGKIIAGIALSIPIALVVLVLLSSADAIFQDSLGSFTSFLGKLSIDSFLVQLFFILIMTLLVFSYVWNLAFASKNQLFSKQDNKATVPFHFDTTIVVTMLVVLNSIYLLFIIIQFRYLFDSVSMLLPAGLTYAEYARKGFFELVMITIINLSVLICFISFANGGTHKSEKIHRFLCTMLSVSTIMILFSAHFRMSLYEKVYGYTYLRFFTHAFMLYLLAMIAVVTAKLWIKTIEMAKYLLLVSLLAFTAINFVNADKIIAQKNTEAYHKTWKIDAAYLTELSYDGVPYMLEILESLKLKQPNSHEVVLLENNLFLAKRSLTGPIHWQSYNLAAARARKLLLHYPLTYRPQRSTYDYMD